MPSFKIKNPFNIIIFGASGDLAKLKLFPALYALAEQKRLPKNFNIVGFSRSPISQEEFQKEFAQAVKSAYGKSTNDKILKELTSHVSYFQGQYTNQQDFTKLRQYLRKISPSNQTTKLAYFSVPPTVFQAIIKNLGETRITPKEDLRLILEKPFGEDTESAKELFHFTARYFNEDCVYLLDHYLGKSAVQSILHLRHGNRILNHMLKGPTIANIQITASESVGVSNRIGYFDQVGTVKDMIQSHLFQILALVAMSIPITERAESLHREKYSILSALKFIESKRNISLGQYESYKSKVPKPTNTETFAALRLFIDRESWYKTPIYIRTGKKLAKKHTYVTIELKKFAFQPRDEEPNRVIFELQPEERLRIKLVNKVGGQNHYQEITSKTALSCTGPDCLPEHGELLLDVIQENRLHFVSFQEIIATWEITDAIVNFIKKNHIKPEKYTNNSRGPASQDALTQMDGFNWYELH